MYGVKIYLNPSWGKLSLEIIAKGMGKVPEEKIINLKELNHFLKTGEYKYKLDWPGTKFNEK